MCDIVSHKTTSLLSTYFDTENKMEKYGVDQTSKLVTTSRVTFHRVKKEMGSSTVQIW